MDGELVPLTTVWGIMEAEIVVGLLRASDIDATIRHEALSTVLGLSVDGLGKQEVLVRREDLAAAQRLLAAESAD
jgi:ribosomal protein L25 (general stress protein Ctc)